MGAEGPLHGAHTIRSGQGGTQGMGGSQDGWAAHREPPQRKQQWITMVRGGLAFTTCLLNIEGPKLPPPSLCGHSSMLHPGQKDASAGACLCGGPSNRKAAPHHPDPADSCCVRPPRPPPVAPLPPSELPQHPSAPLLSDTRAVCALAYFPGTEMSSPEQGSPFLPSLLSPGKGARHPVNTHGGLSAQ